MKEEGIPETHIPGKGNCGSHRHYAEQKDRRHSPISAKTKRPDVEEARGCQRQEKGGACGRHRPQWTVGLPTPHGGGP